MSPKFVPRFDSDKVDLSVSVQALLPFGVEEKTTSRLIKELAKVCGKLPLEEKILIAPSLAIGHQTVERLALSGTRWANLRVETVANLAHAFVGPALANEGFTLLSRAQALAFIEQACAEVLNEDSYFGELADRPGLHRALQATSDELRAAGISPAAIPAGAFADRRKAAELKAILANYEAALRKGKFVDRAEVLRRAADAVEERPPTTRDATYLLPEGTELSAIEKKFLEFFSAGRLHALAADPPEDWKKNGKRARLFRALGEENEVREVFRALLREGISFDEAEVLHTDSAIYPALTYELASQYGIPCTFAGGIAAIFTRPGQAALGFLDWLEGDYDAEALRRVLSSGAVTVRKLAPGEEIGSFAAARALRDAAIGWGRGRHLTCLDKLIAERSKPEDPRRQNEEEENEADLAGRQQRRARRLSAALLAKKFVKRALELAPETSGRLVDLQALARGAREFLAQFARITSELDGTASAALAKLFAEFETLPPLRLPAAEVVRRLSDAVRALHVGADRPRPGHLHVAEYRSGGWSGRPHTFLLGLDKTRHPGAGLQNPVLLDEERRRINRLVASVELPLWRERPRENTVALQACLARLRGKVTASYSCLDLANLTQPGEQFPAPFFLEIYRQASGNAHADYSDLEEALLDAGGFIPGEEAALDETEWWFSRLAATRSRGAAAPVVRAFYPWLADGHRAEENRDGERFTEYDGWVKAQARELDPRVNREPMSCSRIETLASCPYMYFLKHVLKIQPPEELDRDPTRWLHPMMAGSLLHDVFRRFFEKISEKGEKPAYDRHRELLEAVAGEEIAIWREKVPPRSDLAFAARREEILFACRTFLRLEEEHCRDLTPRFFEVPFGLPRMTSASAIASPDPVEIPLGRGGSFLLRGCIDRIDEAADGSFNVWDYKTGSAFGLREELGLSGGRQVQYALYAMALEELLKRSGRAGRVGGSGYFFPGRKGQGQRFWMPLEPEETQKVLNSLFDRLQHGAFAHTTDKEDCRFCDYHLVCGGVERATERARAKNSEVAPPVLRAVWMPNGE